MSAPILFKVKGYTPNPQILSDRMPASYSNNFSGFIDESTDQIVGKLTLANSSRGFYQVLGALTEAWVDEIAILKNFINKYRRNHPGNEGHILIEYPIPRRGKYADIIILCRGVIVVLEFKVGSDRFDHEAKIQVEDYALDLRDFHAQSNGRTVVPLLVASRANKLIIPDELSDDCVKPVYCCGSESLPDMFETILERHQSNTTIDAETWNNSDYQPTPTIIEAATTLFAGHNVREISRSHAGAENLTKTSECALSIVYNARSKHKKVICFITGVPGAGKTLAGLNIVHNPTLHTEALGVFLSGNGPLVKVLQEALARDNNARKKSNLKETRREISTFVQNVHHFLDAHESSIPPDHVIIFDEAQRAWNKEQSFRKFKRDLSEPDMMLQIMDRHTDWSVIIALIGGGQEINTGEAGLREWGRALFENYQHWEIHISPELAAGDSSTAGSTLFQSIPKGMKVIQEGDLHLSVPVRSFRAVKLAEFVEKLLNCNPKNARSIYLKHLNQYPLVLTRDLELAKKWLRDRKRGLRRIGMMASSGERRIKPYGLLVTPGLDAPTWFLNDEDDVRSSYYLEDPATEFSIQGLELDWCCLCWGADFRQSFNGWQYWQFKGTKWQNVKSPMKQKYIENKYRVLLTRAREGLIIWVPPGNAEDVTRNPDYYDNTAKYLISCGIPELAK